MLKRFAGRLRVGRILIIASASLIALLAAGLLVLNWLVVPAVVSRIEAVVERRCDCQVSHARVSYLPFRGVVVHNTVSESSDIGSIPPAEPWASIERIRVPLTASLIPAVRRRDELATLLAELADANITSIEEEYARVEQLEAFLPRILEAEGISVRTPRVSGLVSVSELTIRNGTSTSGIEVDAHGSVAFDPEEGPVGNQDRTTFSLEIQVDGKAQQASVAIDLSALPIAALGRPALQSGVADFEFLAQSVEAHTLRFEGVADVRELTALLPSVTPEPLVDQSLRYEFAGSADLGEPVPDEKRVPRLLLIGRYGKGSIRFSRGEVSFNGLQFSVRPALYGVLAAPYGPPHPAGRLFVSPKAPEKRIELLDTPRMLEVSLELPVVAVHEVQRAIPKPILGPLDAARFDGEVGWELDLVVPLHEITWMNWESAVDLREFAVRSIPSTMNVFKLNGAFEHQIGDPRNAASRRIRIPAERSPDIEYLAELAERSVEQMEWLEARRREMAQRSSPTVTTLDPVPSSPDRAPMGSSPLAEAFYGTQRSLLYVRLGQMSEWVPKAIMTAEDGDFFYHDGVSFLTLRSAIDRNLRAGTIAFGASTISMQLVKMIFLDQTRVFARKFQEVFLVYLMEHLVPVQKARILELYLNIAEFGPGVFGVHQAARYYFDTLPSRLTIGQATWLASVLPSPKRYHYYFEQGAISDGWFTRMKSYYAVMLERERITEKQYEELVESPPTFPRRALRRAGFEAP